MSASLLNLAAQPGASTQPGASQGIAAQAAQAGQAQGPLAGFEALLAALFGDQGVTVGDALAGATPGAGKTAGKGAGKTAVADATAGAGKGEAKAADAATDPTATAAAATTADAALALLVPAPTTATTVQTTAPAGEAAAAQSGAAQALIGDTAGKASDAAAAALAKLADATATAATDPDAAKNAAGAAPANGKVVTIDAPDLTAKASTLTATAKAPQLIGVDGQPVATPAPAPLEAVPTALAQPAALAAAAQGAPAQGQTKTAEPMQAGTAKDKAATVKSARVEGARSEAGPALGAGKPAEAGAALAASGAGKDATDEERGPLPPAADAKPEATDAQAPASDFTTAATTTPTTLLHAAAVAVRGAPQTVANLAAQIAKKLEGRSSRFDLQLDPAGLGKVDVRMEIGASGKMTAAMTFDTPQAAAELRARASELQRALEQAGFDLSGGMSFDVATDRGQGGRSQDQGADSGAQFRGRAFQTALDTSVDPGPSANPLTFRRASSAGVDIRI